MADKTLQRIFNDILNTAGDALKSEQTGSIVSDETILTRGVRTNSLNVTGAFNTPPEGAVGFISYLTVYSASGTFAANEGIRFNCQLRSGNGSIASSDTILADIENFDYETGTKNQVIMLYPNITPNDLVDTDYSKIRYIGSPLTHKILWSIYINGTFAAEEGFDCQIDVRWLLR